VEYGVRFLTAPFVDWEGRNGNYPQTVSEAFRRLFRFITQPLNLVDLFAWSPFYIEFIIYEDPKGFPFLRLVRLVQVFRLFRLHKYSLRLQLILRVVKKTRDILEVLLMFTAFNAIIVGSLLWFAEGGTYDPESGTFMRPNSDGTGYEETPFKSIFHSFYCVFQTTTTVTFGDIYPTSFIGRLVAIFAMHLGIVMLALPIAVLGTHFTNEYMDLKKRLEKHNPVRKAAPSGQRVALSFPRSSGPALSRSFLMSSRKGMFKIGQGGCRCQCTCKNKNKP